MRDGPVHGGWRLLWAGNPGCLRKQGLASHGEQGRKQHPPQPLLQFLPPGSCLESCLGFPYWTEPRVYKPNRPFHSQVALVVVFIIATENLTGTVPPEDNDENTMPESNFNTCLFFHRSMRQINNILLLALTDIKIWILKSEAPPVLVPSKKLLDLGYCLLSVYIRPWAQSPGPEI